MALMITLLPEIEARLQAEAARAGLPLEQWAAQHLLETERLWRIRTEVPETEARELHRLLRRRSANTLTEPEKARLQALLEREQRGDCVLGCFWAVVGASFNIPTFNVWP